MEIKNDGGYIAPKIKLVSFLAHVVICTSGQYNEDYDEEDM